MIAFLHRHWRRLAFAAGLAGLLFWWVLPPQGLDAWVVPKAAERYFLGRWFGIQLRIQPKYFSRSELTGWNYGGDRLHRKVDGSALLFLPRDLRVREVPLVIHDLEGEVWNRDAPAFSQGTQAVLLMEIAEVVMEARKARLNLPRRLLLDRRIRRILDIRWRAENWQTRMRLDDLPPAQRLAALRDHVKEAMPDPEGQARLLRFLDRAQAEPEQTEELLAEELREALPLASFEAGVHRMARTLHTFTQEDARRFQARGKFQEDPEHKLADYPVQARKLWDELDMDRRIAALKEARRRGDPKELREGEEQALRDIQKAVNRYPWSDQGYSAETSQPEAIARTKAMNCVGMSLLMHAYLQALGIEHQAVQLPRHIALAAQTAGGGDWYVDAVDGPDPLPLNGALPPDGRFRRPEVLAKEGRRGWASRSEATRTLAAAVSGNHTSRFDGSTQRAHTLAWCPDHMHTFFANYADAMEARDPRQAEPALRQILRLTPQDPGAWLDLWAMETERGRKKQAEAAWERAVGR